LDSLVVTHPFHPLAGRRLPVLWVRRRKCGEGMEYVCELEGSRRVALRQEWTDRAPEPVAQRVSVEGLATLRAVLDALSDCCSSRAKKDE
jgi:Family of unknown function (DUF5372)